MSEYLSHLDIDGQRFAWIDLHQLLTPAQLQRLPYSVRILLENIARCAPASLPQVVARAIGEGPDCEVPFQPNRLMFHDTTCLPALADFAGMRDVVAELGGDPRAVNPSIPAVLTIDHSVIVEHYAEAGAVDANLDIDFRRNSERYRFIKWAQASLDNFKVIPPGTGIIHQMNMESIAQVVWESAPRNGHVLLHPDCMVATDSHTPMINAIGVLGWGVGGLEGQAAMLGEPVPIPYPQVVGIRVTNALRDGVTATDLALTVTELLRRRSMVGKFVEFTGPGLASLSWAARGTVANMAPEYGATVVFFPFDDETLAYLTLSARPQALINKVSAYMSAQSLWRRDDDPEPVFDELIELDLAQVEPSVAGPHQPHQRQSLAQAGASFHQHVCAQKQDFFEPSFQVPITHGAVVMSAITSCTNTANPAQMIQAGLFARNARARGLTRKPWVKTSLSPGSRVVADYLEAAGLLEDFAALGFDLAGFGCMTCIGNSGSLERHVETFAEQGLKGVVVLSGNRNFEGRVNPKVPAGYLASPALCVAYAIAGTIRFDIEKDVLGLDANGKEIRLKDIWPSDEEIDAVVKASVKPEQFRQVYIPMFAIHEDTGPKVTPLYDWRPQSTYIRRPPYWEGALAGARPLKGMRPLAVLPDNITTDHLSPSNAIMPGSAAGEYLAKMGLPEVDFNSYATHRGDHLTAQRATFANPKLFNEMVVEDGKVKQGSLARLEPEGKVTRMWEAIETYMERKQPLIIIAGADYGQGSSRDWAAKGVRLAGVEAIAAEGFERIHRTNLVGMGVLPLEFLPGTDRKTLKIDGTETYDVIGERTPRAQLTLLINRKNGERVEVPVTCRLDTAEEVSIYEAGGVLQRFAQDFLESAVTA
ncbi:aconitate hydratase AcnA [Pseudomonas sp. K5002]|uniref:aconitate hydratase AcnA n=1 Tax=Pseudomonas sp. K5002 TaxID=2738828 RepID=UPI0015B9408B|nr:aconitate hydratase AcnA [Pseudomonas sp. K5002]NWD90754.1 aconitate hydratase AcnA [Pseudomonas sp. K5002]